MTDGQFMFIRRFISLAIRYMRHQVKYPGSESSKREMITELDLFIKEEF